MDIDIEQLRALMRAMTEFDAFELDIEKGDERVTLRRGAPGAHLAVAAPVVGPATVAQRAAASHAAGASAPAAPADEAVPEQEDPNVAYITSPFVGTYYRSPSPDEAAFVKVGQRIVPGSVLCIVEAMKLMNEIESEISGEILEVLGENGKPVEYGDRLFKVRLA